MDDGIVAESNPVKKFVKKHKVAISVTVTASICLALNRLALRDHNDFLKENNLYDAFYALTDEEL